MRSKLKCRNKKYGVLLFSTFKSLSTISSLELKRLFFKTSICFRLKILFISGKSEILKLTPFSLKNSHVYNLQAKHFVLHILSPRYLHTFALCMPEPGSYEKQQPTASLSFTN